MRRERLSLYSSRGFFFSFLEDDSVVSMSRVLCCPQSIAFCSLGFFFSVVLFCSTAKWVKQEVTHFLAPFSSQDQSPSGNLANAVWNQCVMTIRRSEERLRFWFFFITHFFLRRDFFFFLFMLHNDMSSQESLLLNYRLYDITVNHTAYGMKSLTVVSLKSNSNFTQTSVSNFGENFILFLCQRWFVI